jgi:8-amino-7-oxononanoate synthase/dethiobiotin synthase
VSLDRQLARELDALAAAGRRRELPRPVHGVDFASNDYLDLARSPMLVAAAREAILEHGAGGRAARLLGGGSPLEAELEAAVAGWLGAEAGLFFPSGYQANVGLVSALVGPGDVVVADELVHASLVDGARLSRALVLVHRHGDAEHLARQLRSQPARAAGRRLVLTESVFSMDGDLAPLPALLETCAQHAADLVVDEAHAVGLLGPQRAGLAAAFVDHAQLAARVVTGGKALGAGGAVVVGRRALVDWLQNRARSFVFTTAASPAVPAAFLTAVRHVQREGAAGERALAAARRLAAALGERAPAAAIVPFVLGPERAALAAAAAAQAAGFDVRAVRPPTVPEGSSRLRLVCRASHGDAQLDRLADVLRVRGASGGGEVGSARAPAIGRRAPASHSRAVVVAGTDTGIGKTVVAALCTLALRRQRSAAGYWKPVQTGHDDDTATVRRLVGDADVTFAPPAWSLPLPASPHEAARAAGVGIDPGRLADAFAQLAPDTIVELAGGLLVPLDDRTTQLDLLARVRPRLVLVARSGLGTLNHTLLSLEALRRRRLEPEALFLVGAQHASNRSTLAAMGGVTRIYEVPTFAALTPAALGAWLLHNDLSWLAP